MLKNFKMLFSNLLEKIKKVFFYIPPSNFKKKTKLELGF